MANRVRLDRYYIENWSFWLDLKIIVLTVISLIRGSEKAY
ncbi:MAG: sugar transferase [Cyclobacteriaceae bacterium]